jgi:DNA-binding FrmR family transcriptional regulator
MKRIRGQMESVERKLGAEDQDCAEVLMLLAAVRGGINGLMAEVLEDHIRLHLLQDGHAPLTPDLGEDLIDLVRAYLK